MKSIGLIVSLAVCLIAGTQQMRGQAVQEFLAFSIVGKYQINLLETNAATDSIDEAAGIGTLIITTSNVVQAIALDIAGVNWTNWDGASLVREINLKTGAEAIFLRLGSVQQDVSSFFGGSFSNNFTADVANKLGGFTNLLFNFGGIESPITNTAYAGNFTITPGQPGLTNNIRSVGLFSLSLNTSNLKLNLLAFGSATGENAAERINGVIYSHWIDKFAAGTAVGNFAVNLGANLFYSRTPTAVTNFVSGPAVGSFYGYGTLFSKLPVP